LEAQVQDLSPADRRAFLAAAGLTEPGLHGLVREAYALLGLVTFFTVVGPEIRAWTVPAGTPAPRAAGKVHGDMERGFTKVEVLRWDDLFTHRSKAACRTAGKVTQQGKDDVVQDGDVVHFTFNV
jgi:hypothetical protein